MSSNSEYEQRQFYNKESPTIKDFMDISNYLEFKVECEISHIGNCIQFKGDNYLFMTNVVSFYNSVKKSIENDNNRDSKEDI